MTPKILDSDYATRIKYRLGVTDANLSVEEIDEVLPEIEDDFCSKVTTWATIVLTDSQTRRNLRSSVVCKTASVLCSLMKVKFPKSEQGPSGSFETSVDWDKRESELNTKSNQLLSRVKTPTIYSPLRIL